MALPDFTGQNIQNTYQRVLQVGTGGTVFDGTGSLPPVLQVTASHAISASHETTFEISSSYAQTASAAFNFNVGSTGSFAYIKSSGEISASSHIGTNGVFISRGQSLASHIIDTNFLANIKFPTIIHGTNISFGTSTNVSPITASGAISASGNIIGNNLIGSIDGGTFG